jgi:spermidine synthase
VNPSPLPLLAEVRGRGEGFDCGSMFSILSIAGSRVQRLVTLQRKNIGNILLLMFMVNLTSVMPFEQIDTTLFLTLQAHPDLKKLLAKK